MKPSSPNHQHNDCNALPARRKLLLSLGLGSATIPAVWKKPNINSVLLPAHAEVTTEQMACDTVLFFDDIALSCPEEETEREILATYVVDDISSECPFIASRNIEDLGSDFEVVNTVRFTTTEVDSTADDALDRIAVLIGAGENLGLYTRVMFRAAPFTDTDNFSGNFESLGGNIWTLSGTANWSDDCSVEVINIQAELQS